MELSFIINNPIESPQAEADKAKREANITVALVEDEYGDEVYIISKLSDSLLKIILQHYDNILASEDHILPLEGGLWLEHEGESIYPQCCGELNDYSNLKEIEIFKQRISRIVDEENFRHKEVLKSSLII
ncbi:MAG: hypothetical protein AAF632_16095 [Bacteroidota bacterium]